ncbi:hypothetical protein [Desulfoluna butyratoxydans]|uniref:RiboL-PSP-HEPN domain-containing protein n=1 Tax=Desulfoluna butyratoxydans TaxID=231438 RepID=A0A4U8YUD6_9BACT|nr:hypothetical protein [Desulfoluna butyratoxydans]VFQ47514.1 hypothetical protein MSL71_52140 [Desulfoluna butyratoxydans]
MEILENIQKNIDDFKADILKLDQFLTGTRVSYSFFQHKYPEVQKEFSEKTRSEEEVEGMHIFENLNDSISIHEVEVLKYCFINIIARTDAFLNDIARSIYLWKKPDLQEKAREKIILNFSHSSFKDKLKHFKKEFELTFPHIENKESTIVELFSTRNIILHNNCLVNETYLKINRDSKLRVGDERVIGEEYLKLTFVMAVIIARSIEEQVHLKANNANAADAKSRAAD